MGILPITVYGDRILRQKTNGIDKIDDELVAIVKDMFSTMRNARGIGLAANQVGLNKSLFIADLSPVEGYEKIKPVVMINPVVLKTSDESEITDEGCLSLPSVRADVERPKHVSIRFLGMDENEQEIEASDLFARVILHEYDHLQGKFFTDRIAPEIKKEIKKELRLIEKRLIDVDYPITQKE